MIAYRILQTVMFGVSMAAMYVGRLDVAVVAALWTIVLLLAYISEQLEGKPR